MFPSQKCPWVYLLGHFFWTNIPLSKGVVSTLFIFSGFMGCFGVLQSECLWANGRSTLLKSFSLWLLLPYAFRSVELRRRHAPTQRKAKYWHFVACADLRIGHHATKCQFKDFLMESSLFPCSCFLSAHGLRWFYNMI